MDEAKPLPGDIAVFARVMLSFPLQISALGPRCGSSFLQLHYSLMEDIAGLHVRQHGLFKEMILSELFSDPFKSKLSSCYISFPPPAACLQFHEEPKSLNVNNHTHCLPDAA